MFSDTRANPTRTKAMAVGRKDTVDHLFGSGLVSEPEMSGGGGSGGGSTKEMPIPVYSTNIASLWLR